MKREDLRRVFDTLGLSGNQVVVHASLSSFGNVDGGALALCAALFDAVGEGGTVLMPAFTCGETLNGFAPVPPEGTARQPVVFHPDLPVSREVGAIAEAFRRLPGVLRSSHPTHSFAAWGRQARDVLSTQRDNNPLGPLKKLNVMQGHALLLGTTLQSATAIYLAEERAGTPYLSRRTALRVNAAGYAERVVLENLPGCSNAFVKLEERIDPGKMQSVALARGAARKVPIRYLVSLATTLLESDPKCFICEDVNCMNCLQTRRAFTGRRSFVFRD